MRFLVLGSVLALGACGGSAASKGSGPVAPMTSSYQVATAFMQAAADSNLTRMAQLWGTRDGSAAETGNLIGWEKRIMVMQVYLRGDSTKIVSDMPATGEDSRRKVMLALYRSGCVKQIPATLVRTKSGGWLVEGVDFATAGNPARPCEPAFDLDLGFTR